MRRRAGVSASAVVGLAVWAAALGAAGAAASAGEHQRNIIAPFRFEPAPPSRPSGLDEEKARGYREELRGQLREQETRRIDRSALGARDLMETRRELQRMDNVLNAPPRLPPPPAPTGSLSIDDRSSFERSGGHPQPTPEEVKERQAARKNAPPERALPELRPVYDLYGNRIQ